LRSRAVIVPALLVVASAVVLILAINAGNVDSSGAARSPTPSVAGSAASASVSAGASSGASASPSGPAASGPAASGTAGGASGGDATLGIVASILNLLFLQTPPIGGIYAGAVLAKRSSYLAGGIAGLLGALGLAAVLFTVPVDDAIADVRSTYVTQAIVTSTLFGVVLGGALGYYRRLLRLMNPNRGRAVPASRRAPARRRR
jgi:hypothetical protein